MSQDTVTAKAIRSSIQFTNIPEYLQSLPNWVFYTTKKAPIQISAVARGWPASGWNDRLEGDAAKAGARSNDPNTWGIFDDCQTIFNTRVAIGGTPASLKINGPAFALQEALEIVVIDLDDPARSLKDKINPETGRAHTEDEIRHLVKAAQDSQAVVLQMFQGHYIERSASGKGYHIFVLGKLPHTRYRFSFHGSVFCAGQFINMTGNVRELGTWTSYLEPVYPNNVVGIDGQRRVEWRERSEPVSGSIVGGRLQSGQEVLDRFYNEFSETRLLVPTNTEYDAKYFEDGETFESDHLRYGRRNDLEDSQVIERLSPGMQAVWGGGSITGDHSEDTFHLLGDLEKISGSAAQIERIMKQSPRMQNAGFGNDGQPRWNKHFGTNFNRNLSKVRRSNDEKFAEWEKKGTLIDRVRWEEMRAAFARICGPDDPNSITGRAKIAANKEQVRLAEAKRAFEQLEQKRQEKKEKRARKKSALETGRYTLMTVRAMRFLSDGLELEERGYFEEDLVPSGLMGELCHHVCEGMYEPFMKFAIPASFAGLAGIVARKFKTSDGSGLHVFFVLIALSTLGKTQSIASLMTLSNGLQKVQSHIERNMDQTAASKQGFHPLLERGCFTWIVDECAPYLRSIVSPFAGDATGEHMQSFFNLTFDLGSKGGRVYHPTASVGAKNRGDKPIENLCVSGYWGTTKEKVESFLTPSAVNSGSISRMLIVSHMKATGDYTSGRVRVKAFDPNGALALNLMRLHMFADQLDSKYSYKPPSGSDGLPDWKKADQNSVVDEDHDLVLVPLDAEASLFWDRIQLNVSRFKKIVANRVSDYPLHYLAFDRVGMLAHRLASAMAVLERGGITPVVNVEQFRYAFGYALGVVGGMVSDFDTGESGATAANAPEVAIRVMQRLIRRAVRLNGERNKGRILSLDQTALVEEVKAGRIKWGRYRKEMRDERLFREAGPQSKRLIDDAMEEVANAGKFEYREFDEKGNVIRGRLEYITLETCSEWDVKLMDGNEDD